MYNVKLPYTYAKLRTTNATTLRRYDATTLRRYDATTLLRYYATTLLRYYATTLLRYYATTPLLLNLPPLLNYVTQHARQNIRDCKYLLIICR